MFIWVKIFKTEKTIKIQQVTLNEVCGEVLSEKNAQKSVKTALLLSNVIDADHQNNCLFTKKGHFSSPLREGAKNSGGKSADLSLAQVSAGTASGSAPGSG